MYRHILLIIVLGFVPVAAGAGNAEELLTRSISYHDPEGAWADGVFRLVITTRLPDGEELEKEVVLAPGHGRYELLEVRDGHRIEQRLDGDECSFRVDGEPASAAQREGLNLKCEHVVSWRDYHTYLWGLPMKLRDPGTILDPEVRRVTFQDRQVDALRVTYEPDVGTDIWYLYLDPETSAMVGYEFFKDEEKRIGEYIVLDGEITGGGLRLPKARAWHMSQDDEYLATDVLTTLAGE